MFKINFLLLLIVLINILTITQCTDNIKQFDDKEISGDEEFIIDEADENNIIKNNNNGEQSGDDNDLIKKDPDNIYRPLQIIEPKCKLYKLHYYTKKYIIKFSINLFFK